jgi:phage head maturation protease
MIITKATAAVETVESENPNGEFDVILSTNALDRDGDNLHPEEWKQPLPEHITFDSDHGMSVATTVGSGKPFINDAGQLQVRGTFASTPHAQNVRTLVNEGHIKTTSVAFMERKTGKKDAKTERELLNGAFVAVPANAEAVVLSSKSVAVEENALVEIIERAVAAGIAAAQQTSTPEGGSPQETAEESAADTAAPAAVEAAEESAESVALRARALAFLLKANTSKEIEE